MGLKPFYPLQYKASLVTIYQNYYNSINPPLVLSQKEFDSSVPKYCCGKKYYRNDNQVFVVPNSSVLHLAILNYAKHNYEAFSAIMTSILQGINKDITWHTLVSIRTALLDDKIRICGNNPEQGFYFVPQNRIGILTKL